MPLSGSATIKMVYRYIIQAKPIGRSCCYFGLLLRCHDGSKLCHMMLAEFSKTGSCPSGAPPLS